MDVSLIGCPFQTSYGSYIQRLGQALGRELSVQWVGSNCGCGDPVERERRFIDGVDRYFEWPVIEDFRSADPLRRKLRFAVRHAVNAVRARKFDAQVAPGTAIEHFQQTLHAYGSDVVFQWLAQPGMARRVVTVHELDAEQLERPAMNLHYNQADALLVHDSALGLRLQGLGVQAQRIHLVRHGALVPEAPPRGLAERRDIVFYAGHKPMQGKGLEPVLRAHAALCRGAAPGDAPRLLVHGHYGTQEPPQALELAGRLGVPSHVEWLNQISIEDMEALYARAWVCVLPYSGSFAGLPAATAAAHGLPVIGTRLAGLPEHLGEHMFTVPADDADALLHALQRLRDEPARWLELSRGAREHARRELAWPVVAARTRQVYEHVLRTAEQAA